LQANRDRWKSHGPVLFDFNLRENAVFIETTEILVGVTYTHREQNHKAKKTEHFFDKATCAENCRIAFDGEETTYFSFQVLE
jgi:hypothetical protein